MPATALLTPTPPSRTSTVPVNAKFGAAGRLSIWYVRRIGSLMSPLVFTKRTLIRRLPSSTEVESHENDHGCSPSNSGSRLSPRIQSPLSILYSKRSGSEPMAVPSMFTVPTKAVPSGGDVMVAVN